MIKVAFLGDSITEFGWLNDSGYVKQVISKSENAGIPIVPIVAGIRGNTSKDVLNRLDKDVLQKTPDIVFLMVGLNDIWLYKVSVDEYKETMLKIIENIQKQKIKLILSNLTIISYDLNSIQNKNIDEFNKILSKLAQEKQIQLIDINTIFKDEVKKSGAKSNLLLPDGVHLSAKGDYILAETVFKELLKTHKKN